MGAACPSFTFSWLDNIFYQLFVSFCSIALFDAAPEVTFFNLGLRSTELIVVSIQPMDEGLHRWIDVAGSQQRPGNNADRESSRDREKGMEFESLSSAAFVRSWDVEVMGP